MTLIPQICKIFSVFFKSCVRHHIILVKLSVYFKNKKNKLKIKKQIFKTKKKFKLNFCNCMPFMKMLFERNLNKILKVLNFYI